MMKFELPIVVVNAGELYATSVDTGRLQFYGDEPVEKGGADVGPIAHQLFPGFTWNLYRHHSADVCKQKGMGFAKSNDSSEP
ncbi:MAG: hypothetical protein IPL69_20960 [Saprospiraceae bacterium]|nr:hypothetical protein [Candidatus Brachybacter algidus]